MTRRKHKSMKDKELKKLSGGRRQGGARERLHSQRGGQSTGTTAEEIPSGGTDTTGTGEEYTAPPTTTPGKASPAGEKRGAGGVTRRAPYGKRVAK